MLYLLTQAECALVWFKNLFVKEILWLFLCFHLNPVYSLCLHAPRIPRDVPPSLFSICERNSVAGLVFPDSVGIGEGNTGQS